MALANDVISYDFAIRQLDDGDKDEEGGAADSGDSSNPAG